MANIKKNVKDQKPGKYIIIPRSQDTYEEKYAVANGKKLPFETPVVLSHRDVKTLEHQKEPFQADSKMTVYEVMDKYQVPQNEAAKILQAQAKSSSATGKTIKWRSKYIVQAV